MRTFWLLCAISLGLATIVKGAQVSLTPAAWAVIRDTADRLLASSGFGFLVALTGIAFLGALSAAAWERAERRWERRPSLVRSGDASSLIDDSPDDCGKDAA